MRRIAILLFAFSLLPQVEADSAETLEFRRIIEAYYYAIGENRMAEAINLYHKESPEAEEARLDLEYGQSAYLQRTSTLSFGLVHLSNQHAVVQASHRHLRIAGVKFMEEFTETRYVLSRQGDTWKIWSSVEHGGQTVSQFDEETEVGVPLKVRVTTHHPRRIR